MSQIVYEDVDGFQFVDEFEKLFPEHYEELCVTKDFPYEPDYEAYRRIGAAGMLRCITCRADGELIGYIIFIVTPHLHYKSCVTAQEDIYFVKKEDVRIKGDAVDAITLNLTTIKVESEIRKIIPRK